MKQDVIGGKVEGYDEMRRCMKRDEEDTMSYRWAFVSRLRLGRCG